ncbi:hypothetical protein [Gracilibacillus salinarum]|uniref:LXG domain-containing protein n=1 Tax=Gracilibacillus salinarum TaxID=2932255 RepID=A0ABY4GQT4_9BACI|nr:hypothetical protein [Gracilibacillus salinarum]UOQ86594.1 hypothetical protein MUN87_06820 [Gracilibacillus salinarum]
MDVFYQKIVKAQEDKRRMNRLTHQRKELSVALESLTDQKESTFDLLQKEKVDVEKLESFSIANLFYSITGQKDEKLDEEKQEAARAQLRYQEAKESVTDIEQDIEALNDQIRALGEPDVRYQHLLEEKYHHLLDANHESGHQALSLLEQLGVMEDEKSEIAEAIAAGEDVKRALSEASESLEKAKNWGTADMFGGGLISTSLKHSHIDDAKRFIHHAQRLLRKFSHELNDIGTSFQADLSISGGLTFADYFFDGLIMDWFVQDKINQSAEKVDDMYSRVSDTIHQLKKINLELKETMTNAHKQWESIVYNAS